MEKLKYFVEIDDYIKILMDDSITEKVKPEVFISDLINRVDFDLHDSMDEYYVRYIEKDIIKYFLSASFQYYSKKVRMEHLV